MWVGVCKSLKMVETSGMADIRGIEIDKVAKAYEDEALLFKPLLNQSTTSAREIRWYSKTSGFLTATSPAKISPIAYGARPFVLEQSWTRNTSYVKKYFLESPMINMEDESDSDVEVFITNLRDLAQAVAYNIDSDVWDVVSESQSPMDINSVTSTAAWDASSGQDPFEDIMEAKQKIREQTKRPIKNGVLLVSAKGEKDLLTWMVTSKGTYVPSLAASKMESGDLMIFAGLRVVVSENVTADYAMVADLGQAATWKSFKPITTYIIEEQGIGRKIRVTEHGIAILERPKFVALISNTEE
jgi:hypothetical protein